MQDIYKNIDEYNIGKKRKILIVFYDNVAGMINKKKLNPTVTEFKAKKLYMSIVFITQSYFKVLKDFRLDSVFFIMKTPNKRELQQTALNNSSGIDLRHA